MHVSDWLLELGGVARRGSLVRLTSRAREVDHAVVSGEIVRLGRGRSALPGLDADSFAWHGGRDQLASDARRYHRLMIHGWIVLRFSWEDVMFHPDEVREVLVGAVAFARVLTHGALPRSFAR